MRVSVELEKSKLQSILELTGQAKKSPALARALDEFIAYRERMAFISKVLSGHTDYAASNEQTEKLSRFEIE